ncbi:MAG: photosynthetic reaction center cytochrome c subunit family protein [Acidobacteriota bacterium]
MTKEEIKENTTYGIIGIVAGLIIGFIVANSVTGKQSATTTAPASQVNPSDLPAGHPPIDPDQPTQAGPLPAGSATAPAGETTELPSLDPLPAASKEKRTEQEYKNIQVLRGLPADRLTSIMFAFKNALGVECTHCHIKDQWEKDDKEAKKIARQMIRRTRAINSDNLGGRVSCFTCHRGQIQPPK